MTSLYFINTPTQTLWYQNEDIWLQKVNEYDFLGNHCDDGWDHDVVHVIAGIAPVGFSLDPEFDEHDQLVEYATHVATEIDRRARPDDVDEHGLDSEGTYWGDWNYICNYTFIQKDICK